MGYIDSKEKSPMMENISVVQDFMDYFQENIIGLPQRWDIDFTIELMPGASLVSRAPYRMSVLE